MKPLEILGKLNEWGPVLFGVAFLAPLIDQSMQAAGVGAPPGVTTLQLGLLVGATLGLVAKFRGTWV
jgi:hypothetical protein